MITPAQRAEARWRASLEDWPNGVLFGTPESWDDDASAESVALDYVAALEERMDAAGISREKWVEHEGHIVYALTFDEEDSYDIGSHEAVIELFARQEIAEQALAGLMGRQKRRSRPAEAWADYHGLMVQEMIVR